MNKQTGFTLIELIMVIVILGILAATALPKFVNLSSDARTASVQALEGSMRSANAIVYAKAAMQNIAPGGNVLVNGVSVATAFGYAKDATNLALVMDIAPQFTVATPVISYNNLGATCGVTFNPATASSGVGSVPTYTTNTTAC